VRRLKTLALSSTGADWLILAATFNSLNYYGMAEQKRAPGWPERATGPLLFPFFGLCFKLVVDRLEAESPRTPPVIARPFANLTEERPKGISYPASPQSEFPRKLPTVTFKD
jgi:hypothetical protein